MKATTAAFLAGYLIASALAFAQTKVDQGKPGTQGSWPVTLSGGSVTVQFDGGTVVATQGVGIDGGRSWAINGQVAVTGSVAVTGPLTDVQLRASSVPVSVAVLPLPAGAATEVTLALIKARTDNLDVLLSTRAVTGLTDAQLRAAVVPVSLASTTITGSVVVTGPLTDAQLRATAVPVSLSRTNDAGVPITVPYCTVSVSTYTSVGVASVPVPAAILAGRWMTRICNSTRNTGLPTITCTSDGTVPTTALTSPGETLEPGDCAGYTVGSVINCISDTAATAVTSEECR